MELKLAILLGVKHLATDQKVGGSSPFRRAIFPFGQSSIGTRRGHESLPARHFSFTVEEWLEPGQGSSPFWLAVPPFRSKLYRVKGKNKPISDDRQQNDSPAEGWFVYIVECADRSFYTGITNNLERRVDEHNLGKGARYTRGRGPVALRYRELQPDRSRASTRECEIKALSRLKKQELIDQAAINSV